MKNKEMIVVSGGAGFIGSCLVRHLNDNGMDNIVVVDNIASTEKWKNLCGKRFSDILHKNDFFQWLKGKERSIRAFFHLGACSSTTELDANYLLENNYRYTKKLAEIALEYDIRFIYASSAATYGDGELGFSDDHGQLEKLSPLNMYGYSKHLFDLWLKQNGLLERVVGLKYFNVFGPNEYHKGKMASVILTMVPSVLNTGKICLFKSDTPQFEDGGQMRDFIYVKDVVKMTAAFLDNAVCGIYNVGLGQANTWNSLAKAVFKALNVHPEIEYIDMPLELKGKYQNYTCADMDKWNKHNLMRPEFSLESSVLDYVRNHLHPKRYW